VVRASRILAEKVDTRISLPPRRLTHTNNTRKVYTFPVEYLKEEALRIFYADSALHKYDILVTEVLLKHTAFVSQPPSGRSELA